MGMLRSDLSYNPAINMAFREDARAYDLRPEEPALAPAYPLPGSVSTFGPIDAAYYPTSTRRVEPCLAMDQNNDTNIYVNGLPKE